MTPTPEALEKCEKIILGWFGSVASLSGWDDEPALDDLASRFALALTEQAEQKDTVISMLTQERNVAQNALTEQAQTNDTLRRQRDEQINDKHRILREYEDRLIAQAREIERLKEELMHTFSDLQTQRELYRGKCHAFDEVKQTTWEAAKKLVDHAVGTHAASECYSKLSRTSCGLHELTRRLYDEFDSRARAAAHRGT